MLGPKFILAAVLSLSVVLQVQGHALFTTSAALASTLVKNDATRSTTCDAATALKNPATAAADGTFSLFARSFDSGTDGATTVKSATLDTTGQGKTFSGKVSVVKDGNPSPPTDSTTDQVTLQLPAGTACTGGSCLVELTTGGGFSNCVAVAVTGKTTRRHVRDFAVEA